MSKDAEVAQRNAVLRLIRDGLGAPAEVARAAAVRPAATGCPDCGRPWVEPKSADVMDLVDEARRAADWQYRDADDYAPLLHRLADALEELDAHG